MLKKVFTTFSQNKKLIPILLLLIIAVVARFYWIDKFPSGIDHDELEVVLSAKTYWRYGVDISNIPFPLSLFSNDTEAGLAGLPSFLLAPVLGPFNLNLRLVRLPYVILSLLTLVFLAKVVYELTKNTVFASAVFAVGLINPWFFTFSRETTESSFAIFFIILGIYLLFKKERRLISSSLSFIVAFYSYFGAKPILILLVPSIYFISYVFETRRNLKKYFVPVSLFLVAAGAYFVISLIFSSNKTLSRRIDNEAEFLKLGIYSSQVDELRRSSIDFPFRNIFYNKITVGSREMARKYTGWASSDFLFLGGDPRAMYRYEDHGVLYLADYFLIFLGIAGVFLIKSNKKRNILISILVMFFVLGPLPSTISAYGTSYYFRGFLLMPAFIILLAAGATLIYEKLPGRLKLLYLYSVSALYFFLFINFLVFFFFRYPVKQHSNNYLDGRVMANYVIRSLQKDNKLTVITTSAYYANNAIQFYRESFGGEVKPTEMKDYYKYEGLVLTEDCEDFNKDGVVLVDTKNECKLDLKEQPLLIQNQKDAGVIFKIYGDKLCDGIETPPWRRRHLVLDYEIETMSREEFCNRWVAK